LNEALSDTSVVCLLGPRQWGKSTLAQQYDSSRAYFSLDDTNLLLATQNDPQGFVAGLPEIVTIDEVQRAPQLTLAIKRVEHVEDNLGATGWRLEEEDVATLTRISDARQPIPAS
jgi:predicted AAA+ superfamily ATPase